MGWGVAGSVLAHTSRLSLRPTHRLPQQLTQVETGTQVRTFLSLGQGFGKRDMGLRPAGCSGPLGYNT